MTLRGLRHVPTTNHSRSYHHTAAMHRRACIILRRSNPPPPRTHQASIASSREAVAAVAQQSDATRATSSTSSSRRHPRIASHHDRDGGPPDHGMRLHATMKRFYGSVDGNGAAPPGGGRASSSEDGGRGGGGQPPSSSSSSSSVVIYEGPFASLTLRLKRISLTSAAIGMIGLPALSLFNGATSASSSSVPPSGQLAVIVTAGIAAVGSTALLGYCFSPYVHAMERIMPASSYQGGGASAANDDAREEDVVDVDGSGSGRGELVRIITRDIFSRKVETIFDPAIDVTPPPTVTSRPFCNFVVRGMPMYVHPELLHDDKLRYQLLGGEDMEQRTRNAEARNKAKSDDDEFL